MKLWISADGVEVEISGKDDRYSPDVLEDWCNRASRLMQEQRALTVCLGQSVPHLPGDG